MFTIKGKYTAALLTVDNLEEECIKQIQASTNHPVFTNPIAIMPDSHAGKGSVVGFTTKLGKGVIPATVGVDIGCGMLSANVGKLNNFNLELIDYTIRSLVPFGFETHVRQARTVFLRFSQKRMRENAAGLDIQKVPSFDERHFQERIFDLTKKDKKKVSHRVYNSIGSLGGGNHFIELGVSQLTGDYWLTIHSGSRQFGLKVANFHQQKAASDLHTRQNEIFHRLFKEKRENVPREDWERLRQELRDDLNINEHIQKGMEYLQGDMLDNYLLDMILAQEYARINRETMLELCLQALNLQSKDIKHQIESVHNYIDPEDRIIRKGACRAHRGEEFILPFNMRDGLLICRGKGNPDWNYSAPHGAGRIMSRTRAKAELSLEEFKQEMSGIHSSSVCQSTLDEAPGAYKDSKLIEEAIEPTAEIVDRIKPVLNLKAK